MIYAYDGLPGAGKSYGMLLQACQIANDEKKSVLVTNQRLNTEGMAEMCHRRRWNHAAWLARRGRVVFEAEAKDLCRYRNSVVMVDEAGVFFDARGWAETKKKAPNLTADLCQTRKGGVDIVWSAQCFEQVDLSFRYLTNWYFWCRALANVGFWYRWMFSPQSYPRVRAGSAKPMKHNVGGPFPAFGMFQSDVFRAFDSFARLDNREYLSVETLEAEGRLEGGRRFLIPGREPMDLDGLRKFNELRELVTAPAAKPFEVLEGGRRERVAS